MARVVYEDADGDRWTQQPDGRFKMDGDTDSIRFDYLQEWFGPLKVLDIGVPGVSTAEPDMVKSPAHYIGKTGIEVLDVIDDFELGHYEATIVAYVIRAKNKNGLEDYRKAKEYLDRLILNEEKHAAAN